MAQRLQGSMPGKMRCPVGTVHGNKLLKSSSLGAAETFYTIDSRKALTYNLEKISTIAVESSFFSDNSRIFIGTRQKLNRESQLKLKQRRQTAIRFLTHAGAT
ncbi:hypothetical protein PoB_004758500, partial [Plakobranchus ocellatus]